MKREPNESFEDYRKRLKVERIVEKSYLRGRLIKKAGALFNGIAKKRRRR